MNTLQKTILINGVATDYINVNDRALHYGDGLFETILFIDNKLLYWQQHYHRLQTSSNKLKMLCPDEKVLLKDIKQLISALDDSSNNTFTIKIILSRGIGERGYQISNDISVNRIVMITALSPQYSSLITGELSSGRLHLCQQQVSINESLAGLKHLNRLENVLARNEWKNTATDNKIVDGLMMNANGHVIEGTMSNLFAVKNKQVFTPKLNLSGVKGVMRGVILNITERISIDSSIVDLTLDELYNMDEVFICNSLIGLKTIDVIDNQRCSANDVTQKIFNELLKTKDEYAQLV